MEANQTEEERRPYGYMRPFWGMRREDSDASLEYTRKCGC